MGYVALIKINRKIIFESENTTARWYDIASLPSIQLAFDHNQIAMEALKYIRNKVQYETYTLFELLPHKFTMTQLRNLYDIILKLNQMYVISRRRCCRLRDLNNWMKFRKMYLTVLHDFTDIIKKGQNQLLRNR